jgi:hypothetical protein
VSKKERRRRRDRKNIEFMDIDERFFQFAKRACSITPLRTQLTKEHVSETAAFLQDVFLLDLEADTAMTAVLAALRVVCRNVERYGLYGYDKPPENTSPVAYWLSRLEPDMILETVVKQGTIDPEAVITVETRTKSTAKKCQHCQTKIEPGELKLMVATDKGSSTNFNCMSAPALYRPYMSICMDPGCVSLHRDKFDAAETMLCADVQSAAVDAVSHEVKPAERFPEERKRLIKLAKDASKQGELEHGHDYVVAKKVKFTGDMSDIEDVMDRDKKARETERAKVYKCPCGNFSRKREEGALCNACFGKRVGEKRTREE